MEHHLREVGLYTHSWKSAKEYYCVEWYLWPYANPCDLQMVEPSQRHNQKTQKRPWESWHPHAAFAFSWTTTWSFRIQVSLQRNPSQVSAVEFEQTEVNQVGVDCWLHHKGLLVIHKELAVNNRNRRYLGLPLIKGCHSVYIWCSVALSNSFQCESSMESGWEVWWASSCDISCSEKVLLQGGGVAAEEGTRERIGVVRRWKVLKCFVWPEALRKVQSQPANGHVRVAEW